MLTKWQEDLETGIDKFDHLNQELFTKVNELMMEARNCNAREHLGRFLWFLQRYIHKHFRTEEQLQRTLGYPGYAVHKQQHDLFIEEVRKIQERYNNEGGTTALTVHVIQVMSSWIKNHIKAYDLDVAAFLRSPGISGTVH